MPIPSELRISPGKKVRLDDIDPRSTPGFPDSGDRDADKARAEALTRANIEQAAALQYRLWAEDQRALLVAMQALDTGGKDGVIRHVFTGFNPQGCRVRAFKAPSHEELDHDFLWRVHRSIPPRGEIGVFNRSHYEDVLVVRVHDLVPKSVWSKRYEQINAFERHLFENGVWIIKCYLHISRDEQLQRLRARIDNPEKRWKVCPADFEERKYWDDYMRAYEAALEQCNAEHAPWYVIPADRKWYRDLAMSEIVLATLREMNPQIPPPRFDVSKIVVE